MIDQFSDMIEDFKDYTSLKQFCGAQAETIKFLNLKIQDLTQQISSGAHIPPQSPTTSGPSLEDLAALTLEGKDDAEIICRIELKRLKDVSLQNALTFEEVKKLDLIVKNLKIIDENIKSKEQECMKTIPDAELERLMQ